MTFLLVGSWTLAVAVAVVALLILGLVLIAKIRPSGQDRASTKEEQERVEARNRTGANGWTSGI